MLKDNSFARLARSVFLLVLGLWIGMYATMGVAASLIFSEARAILDADVVDIDALGGQQFGAVFEMLTPVMMVFAGLLALAWIGWVLTSGGRGARVWIPSLLLLAVLGAFAASAKNGGAVPGHRDRMNDLSLAEPEREAARADFDRTHEASSAFGKTTLIVLIGLSVAVVLGDCTAKRGAAGWGGGSPSRRAPGGPA